MSPILDIQRRLHEAGRIRIGVTIPTDKGRARPKKLETFRFTSQDRRLLDAIAELYGGKVEEWSDAPVGKQYQVVTDTAELRVAVPPERMGLSQSMELWSGGGCVRRCDGARQANDEPCLCAQLDADDTKTPRCSRHTRLSLMLADLATTGLWRLDTQGFYASEELAGAFELAQMVAQATGRSLLPGWLRLEQREIRRPGQGVKRFPVPVLDLEMDTRALLGPSQTTPAIAGNGSDGHPPALTPVPPEPAVSLSHELARMDDPPAARPRRGAAAPPPTADVPPPTAAEMAERKDEDDWWAGRTVAPQEPLDAKPVEEPAGKMTPAQRSKLFALFGEFGLEDRDERLDWANKQLERTILSSKELTQDEASRLIDKLQAELDGQSQSAEAPSESSPEPPAEQLEIGEGNNEGTVETLWFLHREAKVPDEWLQRRLAELGVKDPPARITRDVFRRLTSEQARELTSQLNAEVDLRQGA